MSVEPGRAAPTAAGPLLLVGLGNPGPDYAATRHNAGFDVVVAWAERHRLPFQDAPALESMAAEGEVAGRSVLALLPLTFMNRSGGAVARAIRALEIDDPAQLLVVFDDLDLPFGRLRLRPSGGAGGHRGLGDIQDTLGRSDFPRLRVGIGRPPDATAVIDYVLSPFSPDEEPALPELHARAADALDLVLRLGVRATMNRVNAAPVSAQRDEGEQPEHAEERGESGRSDDAPERGEP